jgi:hypothetical protein
MLIGPSAARLIVAARVLKVLLPVLSELLELSGLLPLHEQIAEKGFVVLILADVQAVLLSEIASALPLAGRSRRARSGYCVGSRCADRRIC